MVSNEVGLSLVTRAAMGLEGISERIEQLAKSKNVDGATNLVASWTPALVTMDGATYLILDLAVFEGWSKLTFRCVLVNGDGEPSVEDLDSVLARGVDLRPAPQLQLPAGDLADPATWSVWLEESDDRFVPLDIARARWDFPAKKALDSAATSAGYEQHAFFPAWWSRRPTWGITLREGGYLGDTGFIHEAQRAGVALDHVGFGDFEARLPSGTVSFTRTSAAPGMSGRTHMLTGRGLAELLTMVTGQSDPLGSPRAFYIDNPAQASRQVEQDVRAVLTPEMRHADKAGRSDCPSCGHGYVASEAAWHLLGGTRSGWYPVRAAHRGVSHWWLETRGRRLDLTADQFPAGFPYERGQRAAFLTREPSKRARVVMDSVRERRLVSNPEDRRATRIQTILIPRADARPPGASRAFTEDQAREWATRHGFSASKVEPTAHYWRLRQADPSRFESFATIPLGRGHKAGVKAVIGVPRRNPSIPAMPASHSWLERYAGADVANAVQAVFSAGPGGYPSASSEALSVIARAARDSRGEPSALEAATALVQDVGATSRVRRNPPQRMPRCWVGQDVGTRSNPGVVVDIRAGTPTVLWNLEDRSLHGSQEPPGALSPPTRPNPRRTPLEPAVAQAPALSRPMRLSLGRASRELGLDRLAEWLESARPPRARVEVVEHQTEARRREANLAALRILRNAQRQREQLGELPELSDGERNTLAGFSGLGGIKPGSIPVVDRELLSPDQQQYLTISDQRDQIKETLARAGKRATEKDLPPFGKVRGAFEGTIAQYFTPVRVARAMTRWAVGALDQLLGGERPIRVLEPSAGIGRFYQAWEQLGAEYADRNHGSVWDMVEYDPDLADLLTLVYGDPGSVNVFSSSYEQAFVVDPLKRYHLVLANPPYAGRGSLAKVDPEGARWKHAVPYFMWRTASQLVPRGVMVHLTPAGVISDKTDSGVDLRRELLRSCHFLGAVVPPAVGQDGNLFSGALLNLSISLWAKRPNMLPEVLEEDLDVLDGSWLDQHPEAVMGAPQGGKYRPEAISGKWDEQVMLGLALRVPHPSFAEKARAVAAESFTVSSVGSREGATSTGAGAIAGNLAYRIGRFREYSDTDPIRARALHPELVRDLQDFAKQWGNPYLLPAPADAEERTALVIVRSCFDQAGRLTGSMADGVREARGQYQGVRTVQAAAEHLCGRLGWATAPLVAELLGRPVADLELVALQNMNALAGVQHAGARDGEWGGEPVSFGLGRLYVQRNEEFLSGELYPKLDAVKALLKGDVSLDLQFDGRQAKAFRNRLEQQVASLLSAIDPQPIGAISFGPRSLFVFDRTSDTTWEAPILLDWMREHFGADLERVWVEHGVLRVSGHHALAPSIDAFVAYWNREDTLLEGGATKSRHKSKQLKERISADQRLELAFHSWAQASKYAPAIEEQYNRAYRGFARPTYSDDPIPLGRIDLDNLPRIKAHIWPAVRRATERRGGIMALDVGLGKTVAAMLVAARLRELGQIKRTMICVPNSVGPNWLAECAMWLPDYRVVSIGFSVEYDETTGITKAKADSKAVYERKLHEFAAGQYEIAVIQRSTFESFTMHESNLRAFYTESFSAQRDAAMDQRKLGKEMAKVEQLKEKRKNINRRTKAYQTITDQIDRLLVTPWLERLATQLADIDRILSQQRFAHLHEEKKKERAKVNSAIRTWSKKATPTDRERATDEQKFAEWVGKRLNSDPRIKSITWEELGVDFLIVDEAHNYKNLYGSQTRFGQKARYMGAMDANKVVAKCWDMWAKCAWLRRNNDDSGVLFLTATPLKNSPLEAFNLLSYITGRAFGPRGIATPEEYIDRYCAPESEPVLTVYGGFRYDLAVLKFTNLPELRSMFDQWVDVKVAASAAEIANLRAAGADTRNLVTLALPEAPSVDFTIPMLPDQEQLYEEFRKIAADAAETAAALLCKRSATDEDQGEEQDGSQDSDEYDEPKKPADQTRVVEDFEDEDAVVEPVPKDSIFAQMWIMEKAAIDLVLMPGYEDWDEEPPKYTKCADQIAEMGDCAHIVFCDYKACHPRIKRVISERAGVPMDRIALVDSSLDVGQRQSVADGLNGVWSDEIGDYLTHPEYDVVIGTTGTMGEGMNLQKRACGIHHLTLPWEPASIQQRNGRGVRQGNKLGECAIFYYIADRSFDGYRLSTIKGKRSWMRTLLESADKTTNNPAAELQGPCAMLIALASDREKAVEFCKCLETAAARMALDLRRSEAAYQFNLMVARRRASAGGNERDAYHAQQAEGIREHLLALPDEVFPRKDLIEAADHVPLIWEHTRDVAFIEGTPLRMMSKNHMVERVYPVKGTVKLRKLGSWTSRVMDVSMVVANAGDTISPGDWSDEADALQLGQAEVKTIEVKTFDRDLVELRLDRLYSALMGRPDYLFFETPGTDDKGPQMLYLNLYTGLQSEQYRLILPWEAPLITDLIRKRNKSQRVQFAQVWQDAYQKWTGRVYPADLVREAAEEKKAAEQRGY